MNQWILFGGELYQKTVYKDKTHTKHQEFPVAGDYGYIIGPKGQDITLVYNGVYQVWHPLGVDLARYKEALEARPVETLRS
jgi:hypothetical protein